MLTVPYVHYTWYLSYSIVYMTKVIGMQHYYMVVQPTIDNCVPSAMDAND